MKLLLNTLILALTVATPFIVLYAVSLAKKQDFKRHIKIQKTIFWACIIAVIVFEIQVRFSGGSGSIASQGTYYHTAFFKTTLISHIIGAVLTYIIWAITVFSSNTRHKKKQLPGAFTINHKRLGIISIIGLIFTAITAVMVYLMTFIL